MSYLYAIAGFLTLIISGIANAMIHMLGLPPNGVYFWEMCFAAWLIIYVPSIIERVLVARWEEGRMGPTCLIQACWMIRSTVALTTVIYIGVLLTLPATGRLCGVWDTIATILVATAYMLIFMLPNPRTYLTEGEPEL